MTYNTVHNCQIVGLSDIYMQIFGYKQTGFFIEVGAYNGYDYSNVLGLIEAGWWGYCIEPCSANFEQLSARYGSNHKVVPLKLALGSKVGKQRLVSSLTISSLYEDKYSEYGWTNKDKTFETVDMDTLDNILFGIPYNLDVLSIDTEGHDLEVLHGFNIGMYKPKLCIIEAHEHHPHIKLREHAQEINEYFAAVGYKKIYSDEINNIYIL
jgi:FkbM family methyltransferase